MTSYRVSNHFDCADPYGLAKWWQDAFGFQNNADPPNAPGDNVCVLRVPGTDADLTFIAFRFSEIAPSLAARNRIVLIVGVTEEDHASWAVRVRNHGAVDVKPDDGWGLDQGLVFADPDGNQFVLVRHED